jgi:hypothetical protein
MYSTCLPLLHAMEFVTVWEMPIRAAFLKFLTSTKNCFFVHIVEFSWPSPYNGMFKRKKNVDHHSLRPPLNTCTIPDPLFSHYTALKGTVPRDFRLQVFYMDQYPQAPDYTI